MIQNSQHKYTNSLINETSPYLLQHAHNPVNWHPWGDEAFEKAKAENKLVLVSIGYAACHWCHVMEHESFENEEIAAVMNANYICIKVDREERPDVDQIYMSAVQLLTGSGGWPLNCFVLPDKRPVYGGTYFPAKQWMQILEGLSITFTHEPQKMEAAASELEQAIKTTDLIKISKSEVPFEPEKIRSMYSNWEPYFDQIWGGNKRAPKFPIPISLEFLLNYGELYSDKNALNHYHLSLKKIAQGGIYDHVGGGFARYSVDAQWKVPHFEKMLYDNGQLVSLYSNAYKQNSASQYREVVEHTLNFINTEMTSPEGAFYSSYDADSEGVEGKFYVWTKAEIEQLLGTDAPWFCEYFNITDEGNWEQTNVLWTTEPEKIISKYGFTTGTFEPKLKNCLQILYNERNKRIKPALDDKILTAWNALMSIGFLDAYEAFGTDSYLNSALKNGTFIRNVMWQPQGNLHRNYKNGKTTINGFLDDYALTIQLFVKLYQCTFDEQWLTAAKKLMDYTVENFYHKPTGMFYYTHSTDEVIVTRKTEVIDNVIASSNSTMGHNLLTLSHYYENDLWNEMAQQMLKNVVNETVNNVSYYANWGLLYSRVLQPKYEIAILGPNANVLYRELTKHYLPYVTFAGTSTRIKSDILLLQNRWVDNETLIYVCKDMVCQLPVKSVKEALQLIQ